MGVAVIAMSAGPALAQSAVQTAFDYNLVSYQCGEPACGCEEEPSCGCDTGCADDCCGSACGDSCGSCCNTCCDSGCCLSSNCCLGEPCRLKDHIDPCGCCWLDFGGWTQIGYHTDNTRQSQQFGDLFAFNDVPDQLNLHQQWLWFEKVAEAPCCGMDWGFRFDVMYGTDAQKTQAFGNPGAGNIGQGRWDASLDHGEYGWAMPQLYGEVAFGDWSVIAGHFFTLVGYEVVTAPDNFFYSHAYTMFNSEPFTHTGVLATYSGMEDVTLYGGWTLGWDTGFDQYEENGTSGSSFLGGFSASLTDDVAVTYILTAGDFGLRSDGTFYGGAANTNDNGYSHSVVFDVALSDDLNYVFQSDLVTLNDIGHNQVGINQYLFYTLNDCWAVGTRFEWWKSNDVADDSSTSFYGWTYGLNYKPHANIVIRPEVRHNWTPAETAFIANNGVDFNQTVFGIDAIFTY